MVLSREELYEYIKVGTKFDPVMDANMKYVGRMLQYIKDSKGFRLDKFPGQQDFYAEMREIWKKFRVRYMYLAAKIYITRT